jgi:predicted small lipoprotein YifL
MKSFFLVGAVALIAATVAGCGRMADLEAPPAKATERSMPAAGTRAPGPTEPATINRPPSQLPIDGARSNPFDGPGSDPR